MATETPRYRADIAGNALPESRTMQTPIEVLRAALPLIERAATDEARRNSAPTGQAKSFSARTLYETARATIEHAPVATVSKDDCIEAIRMMTDHGGGFASCLADLYAASDPGNRAKLRTAFGEVFAEFAKQARRDRAGV